MKTTFQTSRPARHCESQRPLGHSINKTPAIEWSFQPSSTDFHGGAASFNPAHAGAEFRAVSDAFFAGESKRSYRLEAGVFGLIAASAAWPLILAAQAAVALLK